MNYRHLYHAGNAADVVKHTVLVAILALLTQKPKPLFALDTHAGIGLYDLNSETARKTSEAENGVALVKKANPQNPLLQNYLKQVGAAPESLYPGSPWLLASLLRPDDRIALIEKHPEDSAALKRTMRAFENVACHTRDGYEALLALTPPPEKRGLVLIDPPYEARDEWQQMANAVRKAHAKWNIGTYVLWYPLKDRMPLWQLEEALSDTPKVWQGEVTFYAEERADRLNGTGLIIINPPYPFAEQAPDAFAELAKILGEGKATTRWLNE